MKNIVKNFTNAVILFSLFAIVLGFAMIAYPDISLKALGIVLAAYLIVQGLALILLDIKAWRLFIPFRGMLQGILSIVLGFLLAKTTDKVEVFFGIALGVWIIVSAFGGIRLAAALRGTGAPWVLMIIMNIIDILIGCLILYAPVPSSITLTMCLGVVLVVNSIVNIVEMFVIKRNVKDVEQMIVDIKDELAAKAAAPAAEVEAPAAEPEAPAPEESDD
ncbi:MAG: DUF308 domain-containing protein [Clostridia bacterium]|nr:DUF308 domain-containing protein [Clostridia bacterium]